MTILITDDNETNLKLLQAVLQGAGFVVLTAKSGQEALEIMEKTKPDFLLTDFNMPYMDGFELISESKKKNKDLPGMIYTQMDAPVDLIKLAKDKLGVDLIGGYTMKTLMDVVMAKFNEASANNLAVNQIK